ncbi:hypothetical protein B7494_g1353 [Chlorociboria aeruginascens]|nr:hypothetical protein B7494_g1353 [Chlorociboria aeruginascens]
MAENTCFVHEGPYPDDHSRQNHALRFLEHYAQKINSAEYSGSYLPYYHPDAVFHDATGVDYVGGEAIWTWIRGLFAPFEKIYMEGKHILVIAKPDGTHVIYCEWLAHFWLKGHQEDITIPRSMVFTLGRAEGDGEAIGFEGLQILDVRLYYDRSLLTPYLRRSEQEVEKFGH